MQTLKTRVAANKNDKTIKDLTFLLFETALFASGFSVDDPNTYANRIHRIIALGLGLSAEDAAESPEDEMPTLEQADASASMMEQVR